VGRIQQIVAGFAGGTRFGIRMEADGLLAAGVRGAQLTWMDARVGDRAITPHIGKPVEVQALWLNALCVASQIDAGWQPAFERGCAAFLDRFWIEERGCLADVVDVDHVAGTRDETFGPNQILAVGGLPVSLVADAGGRRIVDAVEGSLLTELRLRSPAPGEPGYAARYEGGPSGAGRGLSSGHRVALADGSLRRGVGTGAAEHGGGEARQRFLMPLLSRLDSAGLNHVSEIADAEAPFAAPNGCPFQAWSLGELLRLDRIVLLEAKEVRRVKKREPQWA
jgi:glycogen debranching enzyme